jgi:hypothetical protein
VPAALEVRVNGDVIATVRDTDLDGDFLGVSFDVFGLDCGSALFRVRDGRDLGELERAFSRRDLFPDFGQVSALIAATFGDWREVVERVVLKETDSLTVRVVEAGEIAPRPPGASTCREVVVEAAGPARAVAAQLRIVVRKAGTSEERGFSLNHTAKAKSVSSIAIWLRHKDAKGGVEKMTFELTGMDLSNPPAERRITSGAIEIGDSLELRLCPITASRGH